MGVMEIATITRSQDYTTLKQNEDNRGITQQSHLVENMHKETDTRTKQVNQSDNADWMNKKFDAKEKGKGTYGGSGGEKKKKQKEPDGIVKIKGQGGFDIKI